MSQNQENLVPEVRPSKPMKLIMLCRYCESADVVRDAWASWDVEKQEWVLETYFDDAYCNNCEGETKIVEEDASDDGYS